MKKVILVTEGDTDAKILKKVLLRKNLKSTAIIAAQGRYSAETLAPSLLVARQIPVALLIDADTEDESKIQEDVDFLELQMRRVASEIPFKVLIAKPQIEMLFFHDRRIIEQLTGTKISDERFSIAKHRPKETLMEITHTTIDKLLDDLDDESLRIMRTHPLIEEVSEFLSSVLQKQD